MNMERFKAVLDKIKASPESWNQRYWHDGTAHCFAGHCHIMRDPRTWSMDWGIWMSYYKKHGSPEPSVMLKRIARYWLGIWPYEADWLFDQDRTMEDFEGVLKFGSIKAYRTELHRQYMEQYNGEGGNA